ncbi:uncharacterized protein LOC128883577 [Hylaeus volcanicus]|uniref:uncharacterized protein LOC128883577 n=1 Tax=Hylaeus volcanicus TaxID=313075 RepID=UPI0023B77474|nr:uncharacterized protein LOC128883577 [Hylaeus volcanicus]
MSTMDVSCPVVVALNIFDPVLKDIFLNNLLTNEEKLCLECKSSGKETCEHNTPSCDEDPESSLWSENETVLCNFLNYILHEHDSRTCHSSQIINPIERANSMLTIAESRLEGALGAEVFSCYDDFFDSKRELSLIKSSFHTLNSTGLSFQCSITQLKDYWKTSIHPIDSNFKILSCVNTTLKISTSLAQFQMFVETLKNHWNSLLPTTQDTIAPTETLATVTFMDTLNIASVQHTMNALVKELLQLCSSYLNDGDEHESIQQLKIVFPHLTDDLGVLHYYNNVLISNASAQLLNGIENLNIEEVRQGILIFLYYKQDVSLVSSQFVSLFLQWIHHIQSVMCHHDFFKEICEKASSASFYNKVISTKAQDKKNSKRDELNFFNFFTSTLSDFENIMTKISTLHVIFDNTLQTCRPVKWGKRYDAKLFYTSLIQNLQKSLDVHCDDYSSEGSDVTEFAWSTLISIMKQKLQNLLNSEVILQLVLDRFPLLIASLLTTEKNLLQDIKKRKCDLNLSQPQKNVQQNFPSLLRILDFAIDSYINLIKQNLLHPISFMFPDASSISNKYLGHPPKPNISVSLPTTSDISVFVNVIAKELQKVYHCPILFKKVFPLATDVLQRFITCLQMKSFSEDICFLITGTNEHIFPRVTRQFELNVRLHIIGYIMLQLLSKSFRLEIFPRCFHFSIKTLKLQLSNNFYSELIPIVQDIYHQNNRFVSQVYTQITHYVCESNLALLIPMFLLAPNQYNHEDIMKRIARALNHIQTKFCVSIPKPTHYSLGCVATQQILSYFLAIASNIKPLKPHTIQILIQLGTNLLKMLSECFCISSRHTEIVQIHWLQNFLDILKQELLFVTVPVPPEPSASQNSPHLSHLIEASIQQSQPEDQILRGLDTMFLFPPSIETKQAEKKEYFLPNWLWLPHLISLFPETDVENFLKFSNEQNGISKEPLTYQRIASLISDTPIAIISRPCVYTPTKFLFEATCFINLMNTSSPIPKDTTSQSAHVSQYKQNIFSYIKKHMVQLHQPHLIRVTQNS